MALAETMPREAVVAQREAQAVAGAWAAPVGAALVGAALVGAALVEAAPARPGPERAEREALQVPRALPEQLAAAGWEGSTVEPAAAAEWTEAAEKAAPAARPALVARPTAVAPMVAGRVRRRRSTVTTSRATQ